MKSISMPFRFFTFLPKLVLSTAVIFICLLSMNSCKKSAGKAISPPVIDSPEYDYLVSFTYKDPAIAGVPGQLYTDSASFELRVKIVPEGGSFTKTMAVASIHDINNYAPTVVPVTATYPVSDGVTNTWTFVPDTVGIYNIDSVGVLNPYFQADSIIGFNFYNSAGISPGFSGVQSPSGVKASIPSITLAAGQVVSTPVAFRIRKTEQYLADEEKGFYYRFMPE